MPPRSKQPLAEPAPPARRPERRRTPRRTATTPVPADVVAVLVAHDGAAWLPEALSALAASTRVPARVVCVDTGSTDGSAELLRAAYGDVLELPRTTGFGEAVAAALATVPERPTWLWLLHDDVAVEPTTLEKLLEHADSSPSAVLLGPKVRDWHDQRYLVEIGFTTDAAGHRESGLENREQDQGQHDAVRDVLAVGTAAALVRRDVWDEVGGLDPHLRVFRDDLDLGWKVNASGHRVVLVPAARVRHVRAATTGHRPLDAAPGRASGTDRRNALYVLLAHAGPLRLVSLVPRLFVATVLRSLALLLTRQPGSAADEWRALVGVLGQPGRLHRARRQRATTRRLSQRELRPLLASRTVRLRHRLGAVGEWLSRGAPVSSGPGALGDPGPESEEYEDLAHGPSILRALLLRPGVLLVAGLCLLSMLAERSLLGSGALHGGALLAPPTGARDLWASYAAAWHDVAGGTSSPAPPATGLLALLSTLALGKPWLVVDVLLLGSVPLAGLTAYLTAARLVRHLSLRLWAALTWALLPVATGAVAGGRLDAAVLQVALPPLALALGRVLPSDPREQGWWRVWGVALGLSLTCALAPLLLPLVGLLLLVAALVLALRGLATRAAACLLVVVVPLLLLLPWSGHALTHPSLFLQGQQPADRRVPASHLLALAPGGPGASWWLLGAPVVLAGLAGLLRRAFQDLARVAWAVALLGLAAAGFLARVTVQGAPLWPGVPLQLAALALLVAALVAAHGARSRLSSYGFGWRQSLAGLLTALAALVPVVAGAAWVVRGADAPLERGATEVLPPFARAEIDGSAGLRALVLKPHGDGSLGYVLLRGDAPTLADGGLSPDRTQRAALDRIVADLASPRGSDAAEALAVRAVRYVALRRTEGSAAVAQVLDVQPGLVRRSSGDVDLWRVVAPSARLSVLPPGLVAPALSGQRAPTRAQLAAMPPTAVSAGPVGARVTLPSGLPRRLLVLADERDSGWHATLDGTPLRPRTAWGWAQAFELPASGGRLVLHHSQGGRRSALVLELVLLLGVAVLAGPAGRRRQGLEDDVETTDDTTPQVRGSGVRLVVGADR